jgi:chloramphenicol O-acetyltransferase type A
MTVSFKIKIMKTLLNLENWNRKEHFLFFKQMEEPFFGVTVSIDCTKAYQKSKDLGVSFFSYYLHKTIVAVNKTEAFRYRIIDDEVYVFDQINASATIMRDDNSFGFSLIEYDENLEQFSKNVKAEIARIQNTTGLFTREFNETNVIHFSAMPWINFTSFSHARWLSYPDSCPKISFGKMMENDGKKTMSMSIHVHHGLMDGWDVGQFLECFQVLME